MSNSDKFFVQLPSSVNDPRGFYKAGLISKLDKYPWLKVAGMDAPFTTGKGKDIRGIEFAGPNNLITFGSAKNHDINWVERQDYAREKGYYPVFDAIKDWTTIVNRLDAFAAARKPKPTTTYFSPYAGKEVLYVGGERVEIFSNYIKIGMNIIPRKIEQTKTIYFTDAEIASIVKIAAIIRY